MSDEQDEREWADCAICNVTTDPDANPPGGRDNHEVEVVGEPGNARSCIGFVLRQGVRSGCRTTGRVFP